MFSFRSMFASILILSLMLAGCTAAESPLITNSPTSEASVPSSTPSLPDPTATTPANQAALPNPASVYCEQQGGKVEIRTGSDGGQYGVCLFQDGSECDEWAYFRGECAPAGSAGAPAPTSIPRYLNEGYGFSFDAPAIWEIEAYSDYVVLTRPGYQFFVGFQWADEERKPFRTGMPEGEFVDGGTALLLGQALPKQNLVSEGKNKVVAYNGRIKVGDLILVMYLDAVETGSLSYRDTEIPAEIIAEADQIIATFALTGGETPQLEFDR